MTGESPSLMVVYSGWDGYQLSLVRAIAPRSPERLRWRPAAHLRTAGGPPVATDAIEAYTRKVGR
jgi:hypothetical protein